MSKPRTLAILVIAATLSLVGCAGAAGTTAPTPISNPLIKEDVPVTPGQVPRITPQELKAMLDADGSVVVIDTRSRGSYEQGHIPNATHLPTSEVDSRYQEISKGVKVVLYCA